MFSERIYINEIWERHEILYYDNEEIIFRVLKLQNTQI